MRKKTLSRLIPSAVLIAITTNLALAPVTVKGQTTRQAAGHVVAAVPSVTGDAVVATPLVTGDVVAASGSCGNFPPAKTSFLSTDSQVWVDFTYTGGSAGDKYAVEWVEPNGTIYTIDTYSQSGTGGGYCSDYYISVSGFPPAGITGRWTVKVTWNGSQLFALPFTIGVSQLPSMIVTPQVVNVTASETCPGNGSPCTFSYQVNPASIFVGSTGAAYQYSFSSAVYNSSSALQPDWIDLSAPAPGSLILSGNPSIDPDGTTGVVTLSASGVANSPQVVTVNTQFEGCTGAGCAPRIHDNGSAPITLRGPSVTPNPAQITTSGPSVQVMAFGVVNPDGVNASQVATSTCYSPCPVGAGNAVGGWLVVPASVPADAPFGVTVNPAGLSPGQYGANITLQFQVDPSCSGNNCQANPTSVPVTLNVQPSSTAASTLSVSSLVPPFGVAGNGSLTLTINGAGFAAGDTVTWNQTPITPISVTSTAITIPVSSSLLASAGTAYIVVHSPSGAQSNAGVFAIAAGAPAPMITSVDPPSATAGSATTPVTISVSGFTNASVAQIKGLTMNSTFQSSTVLTAQFLPGDLADQGTAQITVANPTGPASNPFPFVVSGPPLQFLPVTPCRVFDTRPPSAAGMYPINSTFGSPYIAAGTVRAIQVRTSTICPVPANAGAYSLNFTVVPRSPSLRSLTAWPGLQAQPNVSTLTAPYGQTIASAGIVPAGADGSIDVSATDDTDLIVDINGVFVPPAANTLQFYPLSPCRVLDTRPPSEAGAYPLNSPLGSPALASGVSRPFPIPSSPICQVPANVGAYSLNVTAVPQPGGLGFLAIWPAGKNQPNVSTMNSTDGTLLANAAIVPAGTGGAVNLLVANVPSTVDTDGFADINGYFAAPGGQGGLNFYAITPCRLLDTRNTSAPLGGPAIAANASGVRSLPLAGSCGLPVYPGAQVYSLAITAFPQGNLDFLTLWPTGSAQPNASTLNGTRGVAIANAAILPAGADGSINVYAATNATDLTHRHGRILWPVMWMRMWLPGTSEFQTIPLAPTG